MKKLILCLFILSAFSWISCSSSGDTSAIAGTFRKNNFTWTYGSDTAIVNLILTISRTSDSQANIIGSTEIVSMPSWGMGYTPPILGNNSINNCSISNKDAVVTIVYADDNAVGFGQISDASGSLSGNNLIFSITYGQGSTGVETYVKQ